MIEDEETITDFASHEAGTCGGIAAACSFHDAERLVARERANAEDLIRARAIKAEMQRMAVRKPDYSSVATESAE